MINTLLRFGMGSKHSSKDARAPGPSSFQHTSAEFVVPHVKPASPPSHANPAVDARFGFLDRHDGPVGGSVGIGVILAVNDSSEVVIEDLVPGWPASFSGQLARGDVLVRVDGAPLSTLVAKEGSKGAGKPAAERLAGVRQMIVGPCNSLVSLSIRQADGRAKDVTILRQSVALHTHRDASMDSSFRILTPPSDKKGRGSMSPSTEKAGVGIVFELYPPHGECRILALSHGGAARLSGSVCEGDIVVSIDSRSLAGLAPHQVQRAFEGTAHSRVTLGIRRPPLSDVFSVELIRSCELDASQLERAKQYHESMRLLGPASTCQGGQRKPETQSPSVASAFQDKENLVPSKLNSLSAGALQAVDGQNHGKHLMVNAKKPLGLRGEQAGRQHLSSKQLLHASKVSAVLENTHGTSLGPQTSDWSRKLLYSENETPHSFVNVDGQDIHEIDLDRMDISLDSLERSPPSQHQLFSDHHSPMSSLPVHAQQQQGQQQQQQQAVVSQETSASGPMPQTSTSTSQQEQQQLQRARAVYEHKAERFDELSFLAGEMLTILGRGQDEGWLIALNEGLEKGLIPSNYIQMIPPSPLAPLPPLDYGTHSSKSRSPAGDGASWIASPGNWQQQKDTSAAIVQNPVGTSSSLVKYTSRGEDRMSATSSNGTHSTETRHDGLCIKMDGAHARDAAADGPSSSLISAVMAIGQDRAASASKMEDRAQDAELSLNPPVLHASRFNVNASDAARGSPSSTHENHRSLMSVHTNTSLISANTASCGGSNGSGAKKTADLDGRSGAKRNKTTVPSLHLQPMAYSPASHIPKSAGIASVGPRGLRSSESEHAQMQAKQLEQHKPPSPVILRSSIDSLSSPSSTTSGTTSGSGSRNDDSSPALKVLSETSVSGGPSTLKGYDSVHSPSSATRVGSSARVLSTTPPLSECEFGAPQMSRDRVSPVQPPVLGGSAVDVGGIILQKTFSSPRSHQVCSPPPAPADSVHQQGIAEPSQKDIPRIALHMLADKQQPHTSPPLEPPVSYRNSAVDDDACVRSPKDPSVQMGRGVKMFPSPSPTKESSVSSSSRSGGKPVSSGKSIVQEGDEGAVAAERAVESDAERSEPCAKATEDQNQTACFTPWNPRDKHIWGASLVSRLKALGCDQHLIDACKGREDLEALYDILSGKFDGGLVRPYDTPLLHNDSAGSGTGASSSRQSNIGNDGLCCVGSSVQVDKEDRDGEHSARETRVQRLHCEANKGESLAQIHIYSARNVPMSPDHMATFCTVQCNTHMARTSLAANRRNAAYNERFDMGLDLREHARAQVIISLFRRLNSTASPAAARKTGRESVAAVAAGCEDAERDQLIGQVRINIGAILSSVLSPHANAAPAGEVAEEQGKAQTGAAAAGHETSCASCEGWYDLCLHGHPVRGPEGVAGLHVRVSLGNIPACLSSSTQATKQAVRDRASGGFRTCRQELVLVPQHRKDHSRHLAEVESTRQREALAAKEAAVKLEQHAQRQAHKLLAALPSSRPADPNHDAVVDGSIVNGGGRGQRCVVLTEAGERSAGTQEVVLSLQAENQRLADELASLSRKEQHQPKWQSCTSTSPPATTPSSRGSSGGGSAHSTPSPCSLSAVALYHENRASLDREIVRSIQQWGGALHRIRHTIGPDDKLYTTVEWLVQEHAKLVQLIGIALSSLDPGRTSLTVRASQHTHLGAREGGSSAQHCNDMMLAHVEEGAGDQMSNADLVAGMHPSVHVLSSGQWQNPSQRVSHSHAGGHVPSAHAASFSNAVWGGVASNAVQHPRCVEAGHGAASVSELPADLSPGREGGGAHEAEDALQISLVGSNDSNSSIRLF